MVKRPATPPAPRSTNALAFEATLRPGRRVARRWYLLLFVVLAVASTFVFGGVRYAPRAVGGFQELERLYRASAPLGLTQEVPRTNRELAELLGASPEDLVVADNVVILYDRMMEERGARRLEASFAIGRRDLVVDYRIVFSLGVAALLALALYSRARDRVASRLIDEQNRRLKALNEELEQRILQAQRYLDELKDAQAALLHAQKLASIGRLSATLAHEIRNPISIILSAAGMAAEDLPKGSPPLQAIDLIRQEVNRLNSIITELLDFSRPKPPSLQSHDPADLVRAWAKPLREDLARQGVQLALDLDESVPPVLADHDQLYQVFLNLLWNARDALKQSGGGEVVVRLRRQDDETAALEVVDDGPGMDAETLAQIYEPFFTTKTHGSGLGLPVVLQLMEGMGGSARIESQPEKGARAVLRLRLASAGPGPSPYDPRSTAGFEIESLDDVVRLVPES